MPTQIQGLVTPVYEPVVTVPATSEVITEAGLTDTALALANRIEFVKEQVISEQDSPEAFALLREDFWGSLHDSGAQQLYADLMWRTVDSGSPVIIGEGGTSKNPGLLRCTMPTDSSFLAYVQGATVTDLPFSFTSFLQATVVVRINEDSGNVTEQIRFGFGDDMSLFNGGDDAILIFRSKAANPTKWSLIRRNGGSQVTSTLTAADFDDNQFAVWRIVRIPVVNDIELYLNGLLVHTIDAADVPVGSCNFGFGQLATVADPNPYTVSWDLISVRSFPNNTGSRAGL